MLSSVRQFNDNRKVPALSEPQIWTALGILAAALASTITFAITTLNHTTREGFGRMDARFAAMDAKFEARFEAVNSRIDAVREVMDARFTSVERRLDGLDGDVAALAKRMLE